MVDFRPSKEQAMKGKDAFTLPEVHPVSENREHSNSVDALSANPIDRKSYASASHDKTIKLWDANTHTCVKTMQGHTDGVWSLNYFKDGSRLISASVDGTARLWDVRSGQNTSTLAFHESKVYTAVASPDCKLAATVSSDKKIAIWDLRNVSQPMLVNSDSTASVTACDFSNDGKAVITATFGGRVNVIDLETQSMRVDYDIMFLSDDEEENMCYHIGSIANHPEGNVFILSSGVGIPNLILYEGWHDEPLHRLETIGKYFGHSAGIRHCEFSPDNSKMLSCCMDHSMRIWNNADCEQLKVLSGHTDVVTDGIWLNENTVVTSSWDCKIMLWNV